MTVSAVLALLDAHHDERGLKHWERLGLRTAGLKSFGIGLTQLRMLAKQIGRNRSLACELWKTDIYDAKLIALLIDDPAHITREQAESQVEELAGGMLAHVFASCDATLAKTPFMLELAEEWVRSVAKSAAVRLSLTPKTAGFVGQDAFSSAPVHRSNRRSLRI